MANAKNFAYSTVLTAPSPATSGTSLVVQSGDGAKFPAVPFNATLCPVGVQPTTANAEIVTVTAISTDTFTIVRTVENSNARTVVVGDSITASITAALFDSFMGDMFHNQGPIKESAVLTASTDFMAVQGVDISGSNGLELPATSSLEVSSFYDPSSIIPITKLYNPIKFSVYKTVGQNVGAASTKVTFDTVNFDTSNNFDAVTNFRFTAPTAGFYQFNARAELAAPYTYFILRLYKNGSSFRIGPDLRAGAAEGGTGMSELLQLAAGDYIEVFVECNAAIALTVGTSGLCYFSGFLVSKL